MSTVTLRSHADAAFRRPEQETILSADLSAGFIPALFSGGDSRIATDPLTGLNKYLCAPTPAPDLVCASSCTASPISLQGYNKALEAFSGITLDAASPRQRADRLAALNDQIEARLLRYFGVAALARAVLCPSGTDALLTTALLLAAERPGKPMTAILPAASETGTGVPMAAVGRLFDGPGSGTSLTDCTATTVEIPLRSADGSPRSDDAVNDAFTAATAAAANAIVYLTHGTKTGLIAPMTPPSGANVIVDACQSRIAPETVAAYLRQGWPVVVTGSKFFGGPAFSGAVLFPRARLPAATRNQPPAALREPPRLGTLLRWTAALTAIDAFDPVAMAEILSRRIAAIEQGLAANPALVPVAGLQPLGSGWADLPSIFTFGVRDPLDRRRLLSTAELRPLYEDMARRGVLLGQPVSLGSFGGLRLAIGATNLLDDGGMARIFAALEAATAQSGAIQSGTTSAATRLSGGRHPASPEPVN